MSKKSQPQSPVVVSLRPNDKSGVSVGYDPVEKAEHYNAYSVEVIDLVKDMGFLDGNVVKYVSRAPFKGHALQDYEKARFYLDKLIAREKAKSESDSPVGTSQ